MQRFGLQTTCLILFIIINLGGVSFACDNLEISSLSLLETESSIGQDIIFEYNYTFSRGIFEIELQTLELGVFNTLTLCFSTSGDKSTTDGLNVTFIINKTKVEYIVTRLFQDQLNHNLIQAFLILKHHHHNQQKIQIFHHHQQPQLNNHKTRYHHLFQNN